ncbi:MAG TPA: D-alanyl-D-alanine carboxypeptidase/D-alanyl-D-alanine-endopeptidase [Steroidobacteraceae bacterium]|nr:D-alanyl-D-alanine carboxypeptidase/D-alanyl-D-alanine-endopeptidase [Steroidobacteraceae bacterium]
MLPRFAQAALALTLGAAAPAISLVSTGAPAPVAQIIRAQRLPASAVSFAIIDPDSGRLVVGLNTDTPRSPASTLKVITTFASLDLLGPAYVWHTRAFVHGNIKDGVLDGDLILQGGGDPYMTLERWWSFVGSLRAKGLKLIHGDIIIDNTAFSLPPEDPAEFDGRPNRSYNVLPDALMVNFQSVEFHVVPNEDMHRVDVVATPAPANLVIENHIGLASGHCRAAGGRVDFEVASPRWDRVVFSGALSPDCAPRTFARVLLHPADYAFGTFMTLWRELGGEFDGRLRVAATPADAQPYLNFDSLTLGEIVRLTNKFSSNLMARHLLLTLGEERFGLPATPGKGAAALAEWSGERGLAMRDVAIGNGSGLSRTTHISVLQLGTVLCAAYRSRYAPEFMASLPLAGVDGTLHARMKEVSAGSVRLKTGHLDGVSGVAGYVTALSGKTFVLVSLVNDWRADSGAAEPVHAALVNWIQDTL